MRFKYFRWSLDTSESIEAENPLGDIQIISGSGDIKEHDTFLDSFFEAIILGVQGLKNKAELSTDVMDEPELLFFERLGRGARMKYGEQTVEIDDLHDFITSLRLAVEELVKQLDYAKKEKGEQVLDLLALRDFLET